MKFIDLFAGIGGFRLGMESAGHECVAFCEIDKFARASYKAIHDTEGETEYHDITSVTDEEWRKFRGTVDVICGGFPCQAFSVAGKRKGFLDETRGTLFFEIARAAKQIKPRILFLENVKGLLSHDKGRTFGVILNTLDELGYDCEWQVLNSKNFGVPQNRERVFIIGHLRGERGREVFPIRGESGYAIENSIKPINDSKKTRKLLKRDDLNRFYDVSGISPCLNTMQGGDREPKILVKEATKKGYSVANVGDSVNISHPNSKTRRGRVGKQIANTLLTGEEQAVVTDEIRIRKLAPRECWRLQGFPDLAFDKAQEVNSNSQLYKQAGNSVTVNVIAEIAKKLEDE
ncbi:MAG: DNA (cytosine-5-)-methyltransferase [Enterococcus sp.]